jgi:hypothetical protein
MIFGVLVVQALCNLFDDQVELLAVFASMAQHRKPVYQSWLGAVILSF